VLLEELGVAKLDYAQLAAVMGRVCEDMDLVSEEEMVLMQCVAVCCSVLQCVAMCCMCCSVLHVLQCVASS